MTTVPLSAGKFEIGRVVERTFSVLGRNFVAFYLLALILGALPSAIAQLLIGSYRTGTGGLGGVFLGLVVALIGAITSLLVQGALVWGAVADLNGRQASLSELLQQGLQRALPILGVSIVLGVCSGLGLVFFLVPGLMLLTIWCVAIPVTVVEKPPGLGSFARSAALTRGNRWSIFGLLVIYAIVTMIVAAIAGVVAAIFGGVTSPLYVIVLSVINALAVVVGAVGGASLYVELRSVKEGVAPETLASVFD